MSMEVKVTAVKELTPNIKMFEFASANGATLPEWDAGAHIEVETGKGVRQYSLANDPEIKDRYVTAVLKEAGGSGGSQWMHENVKEGDVLKVGGPRNNFPLAQDAGQHILIAGGIGITPILAMGYRLKKQGANFTLHYCTKAPEETAFMEEVKEVFGDNVIFHHDGGDPSRGIKLDEVLGNHPEGAHVYVCGPGGLINAAREAAKAAGWPDHAVHFELFSSAKTDEERAAEAAEQVDAPFEIELRKSGITLTVPEDKSILDVLEENDIDSVYVCREGWCGTCVQDLLEGEADHRDEFLPDVDKENNTQIICCVSRAKPGQKLVLDV